VSTIKYHGIPYHVWNQGTDMDEFLAFFGCGPEVVVGGEGAYIYNQRGKKYINGIAGMWNLAAGLGRKELVEAACNQMNELAFNGCWGMVHPRAIELSAKLVEITGGHYQWVMFGCNGSDAVEAAVKMARQYHRQNANSADRGRYKIISLRDSYHGFSYGCLSTSGSEWDDEKYGPLLPGFVQIPPPYCYRCPFNKQSYPECGVECAQALEEKILAEGPETVAALIIEPVMGDFNAVAGPDEYYTRISEICRRYGLLIIADEVTTGFGRTGKLFASQDWNPRPDIMCLGKAITNGYMPLSATLATDAIYQRFHGKANYFTHGVTHGGHPVACAISLAAIDIIIREKLADNAARIGAYLKSGLENLMERNSIIGEVRGPGLMLAIELVKERNSREPFSTKETNDMGVNMALMGLVLSTRANQIRLTPPLMIDEKTADKMVGIIDRGLNQSMLAKASNTAHKLIEFAVGKLQP
jgi:adenosylmethionine-8-amino-7-oxononanoate aminotransferase